MKEITIKEAQQLAYRLIDEEYIVLLYSGPIGYFINLLVIFDYNKHIFIDVKSNNRWCEPFDIDDYKDFRYNISVDGKPYKLYHINNYKELLNLMLKYS